MLTVAVLRFRHTADEAAWMGARRLGLAAALPAIVATFGLTAVVAAAVAPRLPGAGEKALVDTRNRAGSVTEADALRACAFAEWLVSNFRTVLSVKSRSPRIAASESAKLKRPPIRRLLFGCPSIRKPKISCVAGFV